MTGLPDYITDEMFEQMLSYFKRYAPQEGCGVIVRNPPSINGGSIEFLPMYNSAVDPLNHFSIDAKDIAQLYIANCAILAIVHNHPKGSADPSPHDIASMNLHQRPFLIVGMDNDYQWHEPRRVPLVGRPYVHGMQDCYSIVRDYYARELGIMLPDIERKDRWWEDANAASLYVDNFEAFGFVRVDKKDMRKHDLLLCRWGQTQHVNHALIYLADDANLLSEQTSPCIGTRLCLHHPYNGLAGRMILGEARLQSCEHVIRHRTLL